jgi:hypothetical protein
VFRFEELQPKLDAALRDIVAAVLGRTLARLAAFDDAA